MSIHPQKEHFTYLTRVGRPPPSTYSRFSGCHKISILGCSISGKGNIGTKKNKISLIISEIKESIQTTYNLIKDEPYEEKIKIICSCVNAILRGSRFDCIKNPVIQTQLLSIDSRENLKHLDFLIALEIAKSITKEQSLKAFRSLPYTKLRDTYGLESTVLLNIM